MIKNLRTLFLGAMLMAFGTALAQDEVVFDFNSNANDLFGIAGSSSGTGDTYVPDGEFPEDRTATIDGFMVTVKASAAVSNRNRVWATAPRLRLYNESFTVEAPAGMTMTKIYIEGTNGNYNATPDTGNQEVNASAKTVTWTGEAQKVVFSVTKNTQMGKMTITYTGNADPDALKMPAIEGNTSFDTNTTVTITNPNANGDIYYVKNLSNATAEAVVAQGTKYTAAFELTETTVVSAVVKNGDKVSAVATKTFTKIELTTANDIAAFKALAVDTEAKLMLNNAQVLFAYNNDVYVRDASGAIDFYSTGLSLANGQVLNGSVIGKVAVYNNIPELAKTNATNASGFTATAGTAQPKVVGLDEVPGMVCDLVTLKGVTIVAEDAKYYATNEDGDKVQIYDKFSLKYDIAAVEEGKAYDITGIVIPYGSGYEICPTVDFTNGATSESTPVASIADLLNLNSPSTNIELTLTNAQVLFNDGNYIYVRENGKAVCFYSMPDGLKTLLANNAIVNGKVDVDYEVYYDMPEVKKNAKTENHTLTATEGEEPAVTATTLANVAAGLNTCDLVTLTATLDKEVSESNSTTYYLKDGDVRLVVVNNSKNLGKIEVGTKVTVTGVVKTDKSGYQVKLVKNAEYDSTGIQNVVAETTETAIYNMAGQRVNAEFKGVIIMNGKKYIAQ